MQEDGFKYYAFISYSHKDKKTAKRLHKRLRSYHLPSKLIQSHPELPKKLGDVFLDEANLVAKDGSLTESLRKYLDESNYLILICSPDCAKSPYVNDEVEYFMSIGRRNHIVPLIVRGIPRSKDPDAECFVPAILDLPRELEPLGIDMKTYGERDSFLRVIATTLGLDLDNFISIEARERRRKMMIFSSIAAVFMLGVGLLVWHNFGIVRVIYDAEAQYNLGNAYIEKQDYVKAKEWHEKAAANGYVPAQIILGGMYDEGVGVSKDRGKSEEWYGKARKQCEIAASNGNAEAYIMLGQIYWEGLGVEKDYKKAVDYIERAVDNGSSEAQIILGDIYTEGFGEEVEDYSRAKEWYEKAAENGNVTALIKLGEMYMSEQNYAKAREYFERAAEKDSTEAQIELGNMYFHSLGVKEDYEKAAEWYEKAAAKGSSFAQGRLDSIREENDKLKAREKYEKAAENGNVTALIKLGEMYMSEQNYVKAREYFEKAAENGNTEVQIELGHMYMSEGNYAKAREHFERAAEKDITQAQVELGTMYFHGLGVKQDYEKAAEWYEKAAAKGDYFAQGRLDSIREENNTTQNRENYEEDTITGNEGLGVEQDYASNMEWLEKIANNGDVQLQLILGDMYYYGLDVEQDYAKALEWYEKAASNGNEEAKKKLIEINTKLTSQDNQ
ncbi:MAG: toll/interleukin-1 receptor domain-containing protein [Synergistaceae bacterium]|nr:toll/interleukin-1 receptor domain-containing protein [Synergistaceae bacterium]